MSHDEVREAEARLDIPRLVAAGVEGAVMETFEFPVRRAAAVVPVTP
jgi:hypothetical protein